MKRRKNPDDRLRRLERLANQGDEGAYRELLALRVRTQGLLEVRKEEAEKAFQAWLSQHDRMSRLRVKGDWFRKKYDTNGLWIEYGLAPRGLGLGFPVTGWLGFVYFYPNEAMVSDVDFQDVGL